MSVGSVAMPSGGTALAGVIGSPIRHSLSPTLMNTAFCETGVDATFLAFDVDLPHAASAVNAMRTMGFLGLSVTMPLKAAVIDSLDGVSEVADRLGAVNCIVPQKGRLIGHSTDGAGLLDALRDDCNFDPLGKRIMVLGAGGAARAAILALADAGADSIVVVNRTESRAEAAALLAGHQGRVGHRDEVGDVDLVVNATPQGMVGDTAMQDLIDLDRLGKGQLIYDMVYVPTPTHFVASVRAQGVQAENGLGMLVHQAAHAFTLWTDCAAPIAAMRRAADAMLQARAV